MNEKPINDWRKVWRKNPINADLTSLRLTIALLSLSLA